MLSFKVLSAVGIYYSTFNISSFVQTQALAKMYDSLPVLKGNTFICTLYTDNYM